MKDIPYRLVGALSFFERKEVKDMLAYLRVLINPDDDFGLERIINVPRRGIGAVTIKKLKEYAFRNNRSCMMQPALRMRSYQRQPRIN